MKTIENELNYMCDGILRLLKEYTQRIKLMHNINSVKNEYYAFIVSLSRFLDMLDELCARTSLECMEADRMNDTANISYFGTIIGMCLEYRAYTEEYIAVTERLLGEAVTDTVSQLIMYSDALTRKTIFFKTGL